ncbi:UNVERIFIED_CONTAM: hypothetical protein GTU68_026618 [Idotea baltica]|nr:hypothetical protein [Idotea baltica]
MGVEDSIKGRVVEAVQADLANGQDAYAWRKIRLVIDDTRGRDALTSFYGVDMTRDQFCALIKKRKTLIEAVQDVKSQDGYVLRVFAIAFTKETFGQKRKTNYALSSQQKSIRRKINEIVAKEISKANANQILNLFTSEVVEKKITKEVSPIYPVRNVRIRKIKVIQRPKVDSTKLAEMHDNDKRILTKAAEGKKALRGDKKKKEEDTNEAVNLLNRE